MFLFRLLFWLGLVVLILPPASDGTPPPRVSLLEAVSAARIFATDIAGACERNPQACQVGGDTVALFGKKAQTGMDIVGSILSSDAQTSDAGSPDTGTLTEKDLLTKWSAGAGE